MNANAQCNKNGFTLIELLVALAIAGLVSTAIFAAYNSQEKVHKTQQRVAEMQQNAKAAMLMVTREVRMANAYMGASGLNWKTLISSAMTDSDGNAYQSFVFESGIEAYNNYDYDGDGTGDGADRVDIVYADFNTNATVDQGMPKSSAVIKVDEDNGFKQFDLLVISDGRNANIMSVTNIKKQNNSGEDQIIHNSGNNDIYNVNTSTNVGFPSGGYPPGSQVFKVKWISFAVNNVTDPEHPRLMFDLDGPLGSGTWQPLVQDVEDFQVKYIMADGSEIDQPDNDDGDPTTDYSNIQSVRIHIVARTSEEMKTFPENKRPALADRAAAKDEDKYQRRILTEEVQIRNLSL